MSVIPSPSSGSARPRPSLPSSPHSSTPADGTSSSHSLVRKNSVHLQVESSQNQSRLGRRVTINMLPDGVLLDIFGCYVNDQNVRTSDWHTLLHVCQRWRYLTFASPLRLGLRLEYTGKKPMAAMLDVWPVLPIVITQSTWVGDHGMSCANNIVTALESEHSDHIHGIQLFDIPSSLLERVAAAMQKPFPELLDVLIWVTTSGAPVLSNSFLGGSAPNLRSLRLDRTPFPAMQKLLLSADELVVLDLWSIPDSGYISPQTMVTCLSTMSRLESLHIEFQSPRSRPDPDNRRPTPLTRHVLHFLVWWEFKGVHEYLEDVMAWIDAPHLSELSTFFFMDLDFHVPQLHRFIGHSEELKKLKRASIAFTQGYVTVTLAQFTVNFVQLLLQIRCQESDWLLSTMAQVFHSSLPPFSSLEELVINDKSPDHQQPHWKDDMESTQWLELLDPFATVKDLYLSKGVALRLEHALQELDWERVAEVLPALQNIFVEDLEPSGLDQADLGKLVAARQLSSHPVAIHRWGPEGSLHL